MIKTIYMTGPFKLAQLMRASVSTEAGVTLSDKPNRTNYKQHHFYIPKLPPHPHPNYENTLPRLLPHSPTSTVPTIAPPIGHGRHGSHLRAPESVFESFGFVFFAAGASIRRFPHRQWRRFGHESRLLWWRDGAGGPRIECGEVPAAITRAVADLEVDLLDDPPRVKPDGATGFAGATLRCEGLVVLRPPALDLV